MRTITEYFENGNIKQIKKYYQNNLHQFGYEIKDNDFILNAAYIYYGLSGKENKLYFIYDTPIEKQKYIKYLYIFRKKSLSFLRRKRNKIFELVKDTKLIRNGNEVCRLITQFL